jgi:hypothetical protein
MDFGFGYDDSFFDWINAFGLGFPFNVDAQGI